MSHKDLSQTLHFNDGSIALTCRNGITSLSTYPNTLDKRRFIAEARAFLDALESFLDAESKLLDLQQETELRQAEVRWITQEAAIEQARRFG
jgi:hypothetical protein